MNPLPNHAEEVTTYADFDRLVVAPYFAGGYPSVIAVGRPGLAKSRRFQQHLDDTSYLIRGWAKPVQTLIEVYENRNKLLIFDDSEPLWKSDLGRVLIRSLTESATPKTIQVTTTNHQLRNAGIPSAFQTTSHCAFLANNFRFGHHDELEAILDRSQVFYFNPTPLEVHLEAGRWLWPDAQEIYDFVGQRLHLLENHSLRTYEKLWRRRQAGGDWQEMLFQRFCLPANKRLVMQLEADWKLRTVEEKVQRFIELRGGGRSTYFYIKRQLGQANQLQPLDPEAVPRVVLNGNPPEIVDVAAAVAQAQAARWPFGWQDDDEDDDGQDGGDSSDESEPTPPVSPDQGTQAGALIQTPTSRTIDR